MAEFVIGESKRMIIPLDDVIIGRRDARTGFFPDLDLSDLPDGLTVSRRHARLFRRDGRWFLEPGPTARNGTFLRGQRLAAGQTAPVNEGDAIRLGDVTLTFHTEAQSAAPVEYCDEFLVGNRWFPVKLAEGRTIVIGRRDGDYCPEIDLTDIPEGDSVAPSHARLFRSSGEVFLQVQEPTKNQTAYRGTPIESPRAIVLRDGDTIQFGRVVATFQRIPDTSRLSMTIVGDAPEPDGPAHNPTPEFVVTLDERKMQQDVEEIGHVIDRMNLLSQIRQHRRN
jgi:pSer/pThr/pTyr-binding forkhead associated (FHA) protein